MRTRMVALATVLMLAAGQVAGCAGNGDEESDPIGGTEAAQREILVAVGAILTVLAAGIATSGEDD